MLVSFVPQSFLQFIDFHVHKLACAFSISWNAEHFKDLQGTTMPRGRSATIYKATGDTPGLQVLSGGSVIGTAARLCLDSSALPTVRNPEICSILQEWLQHLSPPQPRSFKYYMVNVLGEFLQQPVDFARVGSDLVCSTCLKVMENQRNKTSSCDM